MFGNISPSLLEPCSAYRPKRWLWQVVVVVVVVVVVYSYCIHFN